MDKIELYDIFSMRYIAKNVCCGKACVSGESKEKAEKYLEIEVLGRLEEGSNLRAIAESTLEIRDIKKTDYQASKEGVITIGA